MQFEGFLGQNHLERNFKVKLVVHTSIWKDHYKGGYQTAILEM